jgi:hypothetical protein
MPAMMDTILNVPMTDEIAQQLIAAGYDEKWVCDIYRVFLRSYGTLHLGIPPLEFSERTDDQKAVIAQGLKLAGPQAVHARQHFDAVEMRKLVRNFQALIRDHDMRFDEMNPFDFLVVSVADVFKSWQSSGVDTYRKTYGISRHFGTAVAIQKMVFGNLSNQSGTGVVFTSDLGRGLRNPNGTWKWTGQGLDVVGGTSRDVVPVSAVEGPSSLEMTNPDLYRVLAYVARQIQSRQLGECDLEMTLEDNPLTGKSELSLLQSRPLVLTGQWERKRLKVRPEDLSKVTILGEGIPVSPNAAVGRVIDGRRKTEAELLDEVHQVRTWMNANGEQDLDIIFLYDYVTDLDAANLLAVHQRYSNYNFGLMNPSKGIHNHASLLARKRGMAYVTGVNALEFLDDGTITLGGGEIYTGIQGPILAIDAWPSSQSPTSGLVMLEQQPYEVIPARQLVARKEMRTRLASSLSARGAEPRSSAVENRYSPAHRLVQRFLGSGRPYADMRDLAVSTTHAVLPPLPQEVIARAESFLRWDLFEQRFLPDEPRVATVPTSPSKSGMAFDVQLRTSLPDESYLYGIAQLLKQESGLFVRLLITGSDGDTVNAMNRMFQLEYGDIGNRFEMIHVSSDGKALASNVHKVLQQSYAQLRSNKQVSMGTYQEFLHGVILSSTSMSLLDAVSIPVGWRIHDDSGYSQPGAGVHLIRKESSLALGHMKAEEIDELQRILASKQVISSRALFRNDPLDAIVAAFVTDYASRRFYTQSA